MKKSLITFFATIFSIVNTNAQHIGNSVYSNNRTNNYNNTKSVIRSNDSILVIKTNALLYKKADAFSITFALQEEGETPLEANIAMTGIIVEMQKMLKANGIKEEDVFVDFISQSKIYDFEISQSKNEAVEKVSEYEKGIVLKKNIIITLNDEKNLQKIINEATKLGVFDIAKIDYIVKDKYAIYEKMMREAMQEADKRKSLFTQLTHKKIWGTPQITDVFTVKNPSEMYESYKAYEAPDIRYGNDVLKKYARKSSTHYYDGTNENSIDKVLNSTVEVGVQFVLQLEVTYNLEKDKN